MPESPVVVLTFVRVISYFRVFYLSGNTNLEFPMRSASSMTSDAVYTRVDDIPFVFFSLSAETLAVWSDSPSMDDSKHRLDYEPVLSDRLLVFLNFWV